MKKSILWMRESILLTLLASVLVTVIGLVGTASLQAIPKTTVYLDPPTINGTAIGQNFTVNLMIRDAYQIRGWQAGLIFNPNFLECTGFFEGEFLKSVGQTNFNEQDINNTAGLIIPHSCSLVGLENNRTGDGQLGYLTFKVKAPGVSDLHLRDVKVFRGITEVRIKIIDVYTVVLDTTPHTVFIVSNSTGLTGWYHSGFYNHAFNPTLKTLSFNVTGPRPGFSNVTIPKTLLNVSTLDKWKVRIDGILLSAGEINATENGNTSIYFTYSKGIHEVQITTRISSTISIALSSTSIVLGSNVTMSGNITAEDFTGRPNVTVTIQSRPIGAVTWGTIDTVETDENSIYTYPWEPETGGIHEVMASWEGDEETISDESDVLALTVLYVFEPEGVYIETNSTVAEFNSISAFNFSQPLKQISFNITSPYSTIGFSNVTIPKTLLPPPVPPIRWKVVINGTLLSAGEINATENGNTSIYFTYRKGVNIVEITTRMSSTLSLALSSTNITKGEDVTVSGNVTAEDQTVRPYVNVTIQYALNGGTWTTLGTVETNSNGSYTYPWEPGTAGIYEVMTSWLGDDETLGDKSDVRTLTVIENSTISFALSSTSITFGESVTISGAIDPQKPNMLVYIQYKLIDEAFWHAAGHNQTDQDSSYTFTWTPEAAGTYEVKVIWLGDETTEGAESGVLTLTVLKKDSVISIALSSTNITKGEDVTVSGNVTAEDQTVRPYVNVTIQYALNGGTWTTLGTVETNSNGSYTYPWEPEKAGTYEVKASWEGDEFTNNATSDVLTLKVKGAPGIPVEIVIVAVVAIAVIAAVVVYFVKIRKP